ncbi:MAG: YihY/virulence factor BrkB family protein [Planctomycetaceae bacterium]|nr:YihY/virulence factor BrkB family protein [Planctomycetaceae bacterium]
MRKWTRRIFEITRGVFKRFSDDDGPLMSAAVAYYMGLSFFPLMMVLIAGVGLFLKYSAAGQDAEQQVLRAVSDQLSPAMRTHVETLLTQVRDRSELNAPTGLLSILIAAMAAFAQFERAFNHIWHVPSEPRTGILAAARRIIVQRGIAFLMLMAAGLLVLLVFICGMVLDGFQRFTSQLLHLPEMFWNLSWLGLSLVLNGLVFTMIYRWLPKAPVRWTDAFRGGLLASIGWEAGRQVLAAWVIDPSQSVAYGVAGSLLAILLWCYYAVTVLFLGAEYIQELVARREAAAS